MKNLFFLLIFSALLMCSCNNNNGSTQNLDKVNMGMTKTEVLSIVGEANNIIDQNKYINQNGDTINWSVWFYNTNIAFVFVNDSLAKIDSNRIATMQKNNETLDVNVVLNN